MNSSDLSRGQLLEILAQSGDVEFGRNHGEVDYLISRFNFILIF